MPATARPLGAVLALGACLLGFAGGGLAHADPTYGPANYAPWSGPMGDHDPNAYRADVARYGMTGNIASAESLARTICTALQDPKLEDADLVQHLAEDNAYRVPAMTMVVHAAEWHYCSSRY
ncbi:DUF732 domain-containing protein [Mycolicibacterium fluoranthenivorans]|uniref:DUF732 domain-containing protein n=1 Tax=Mycolicibacterium fluoranthenivorans TaxID=258505 RepID=A0A7G8PB12_9MYCO|nr:DUF732 domain-containing protein [Mycolicibacterium fluoranthenivorans]QNJ91528.1 DUF732 domain-containing protein [Mycolicibacterium fluoranthenivorans]QNJ94498.1 DUF732 domain-containing protein [Mycolicibacterium fluoranthenivorans]